MTPGVRATLIAAALVALLALPGATAAAGPEPSPLGFEGNCPWFCVRAEPPPPDRVCRLAPASKPCLAATAPTDGPTITLPPTDPEAAPAGPSYPRLVDLLTVAFLAGLALAILGLVREELDQRTERHDARRRNQARPWPAPPDVERRWR